MPDISARSARIDALDIARGAALLAMASYHFTWDLEFFGYVEAGTTSHGAWKFYARCIASSFLIMVGVGLFLAHGRGIRWPAFWKRFAMIAGAAAAISAATWFATPDAFIFFGILHEIALGSLLGLAFLRLPALPVLAAAAAVVAAPWFLRAAAFDNPLLWWLGLAPADPRSNDYVPLFPWFGAILAGIALARLARRYGLAEWLAGLKAGAWARPFRWAGRHSLVFYLVHQPVLIACVWLFAQVWPAPPADRAGAFIDACEAQCANQREAGFCRPYCGCMLGKLETEELLGRLSSGAARNALHDKLDALALECEAQIDDGPETPSP
ncbi:MAG: DUF1624 domain-containing protein [Rhizobiales bacterium]|nr:DUF1624 domain-containing protein [Hyphomicrobiales bacterium]